MKVIKYILLAMIPFFAGTAFAQKIRIQTETMQQMLHQRQQQKEQQPWL